MQQRYLAMSHKSSLTNPDTRWMGGSAANPKAITGPSAWYGQDLQQEDSWIWSFNHHHLKDIHHALQQFHRSGKSESEMQRDDFPLHETASFLQDVLHELEYGTGLALLRGLDLSGYTYQEIRQIYWGMGLYLGKPESQNIKGELMQEITDMGFDYTKSEHRGSMTAAELKPHCDVCDLVGLLCIRGAKSGGVSTLRSSMTIYNEIFHHKPHLLSYLHEGFFFELDGKGPTGAADEITHRIPVYSWHQGYLSCRYNQKAIEGGMIKAGLPLTGEALEAVEEVARLAQDPRIVLNMDFQPGDIQLLNNYVTLHARTKVIDHEDPARKRLLLRLWLNHDGARPLDDDFANKTLNGPRRGVQPRASTI